MEVMRRFNEKWLPDRNVEETLEENVIEVQFGDGVIQTQQKFLASPKRNFSLTFSRSPDEIKEIRQFLLSVRGKRFIWNFLGEDIVVHWKSMKRHITGQVDVLSVEFKER